MPSLPESLNYFTHATAPVSAVVIVDLELHDWALPAVLVQVIFVQVNVDQVVSLANGGCSFLLRDFGSTSWP